MGVHFQLRGAEPVNHDFEKNWFGKSLNQIGIARASEAIQKLGKALPCKVTAVSGSFVTVEFEVNTAPWTLPAITIPKAEGPWIRSPTQVGDYGLTMPADAYINAISGQGGGTPDLTPPGNLAALVWVPVASKAFSSVNTNAAFIQGPQRAVLQTEDGNTVVTINETRVTIKVGSLTWTITASGFTGSGGVVFETHIHAQGIDSHGDTEADTGPPIA